MKKTKILFAAVMLAALLAASALASFALAPPSLDSTTWKDFGVPDAINCDNLVGLVNAQDEVGSFNSLVPAVLYQGATTNTIILVLAAPSDDFTVALADGSWSVSTTTMFRMVLTEDGFSFQTIWGNIKISDGKLIAYRATPDADLVANTGFAYGTYSEELYNLYVEWAEYRLALKNYETNLETKYDEGYDAGYNAGEQDGYDEGFGKGWDSGYDYGYDDGYDDAYTAAKTECEATHLQLQEQAWDDGYDQGYSKGEVAGYEYGYRVGQTKCQATHESLMREEYEAGYQTGYDDGKNSAAPDTTKEYKVVWLAALDGKTYNLINGASSYYWDEYDGSFLGLDSEPAVVSTIFLTNTQIENPDMVKISLPDLFATVNSRITFDRFDPDFFESEDTVAVWVKNDYGLGYTAGYNKGETDAINSGDIVVNYVDSIFSAPINALYTMLDIEILGVNLFNIFMVVLSALIIGAVVLLVLKFR